MGGRADATVHPSGEDAQVGAGAAEAFIETPAQNPSYVSAGARIAEATMIMRYTMVHVLVDGWYRLQTRFAKDTEPTR